MNTPKIPLVLGFDTSAGHCAAALIYGEQILASKAENMSRGQAERLMLLLEEVLQEAGKIWADLDAIGVGTGPGNFTGIRISVSAARGLALALEVPAVGVSTFEATALDHPGPYIATVPAPRGQTYIQESDPMSGPRPAPRLCPTLPETDLPVLTPPEAAPLAVNIARAAARRYQQAPARPAPLYIKAADAAPPRDPAPVILS